MSNVVFGILKDVAKVTGASIVNNGVHAVVDPFIRVGSLAAGTPISVYGNYNIGGVNVRDTFNGGQQPGYSGGYGGGQGYGGGFGGGNGGGGNIATSGPAVQVLRLVHAAEAPGIDQAQRDYLLHQAEQIMVSKGWVKADGSVHMPGGNFALVPELPDRVFYFPPYVSMKAALTDIAIACSPDNKTLPFAILDNPQQPGSVMTGPATPAAPTTAPTTPAPTTTAPTQPGGPAFQGNGQTFDMRDPIGTPPVRAAFLLNATNVIDANGQPVTNLGQRAVMYGQYASSVIANLPVDGTIDKNAIYTALGVTDEVTANNLKAAVAAMTPEQRAAVIADANASVDAWAAKLPEDKKEAMAPVVAQMHSSVNAMFSPTQPADTTNQLSPADRIVALKDAKFKDDADSAEKKKLYDQLVQQQESQQAAGPMMGIFMKIINMFTNAIGGHPELNQSPEEFLAANQAALTNYDEVKAKLDGTSPTTPTASTTPPAAGDDKTPDKDATPPVDDKTTPPAAGTTPPVPSKVPTTVTSGPGSMKPIPDKAFAEDIQKRLEAMGLATDKGGADGVVDGVIGSRTKDAIHKFEADHGLALTQFGKGYGTQISQATYDAILAAGKQATTAGMTTGQPADGDTQPAAPPTTAKPPEKTTADKTP